MLVDKSLLDYTKRLMLSRYPRFGAEIASTNLEFRTDLPSHTAATDGTNIYFDPNYLESLTDEERVFVIAHEIMHIKFEHMFRLKDKNGQIRDPQVWNIATDAIINANLQKDGFTIKKGYVDMPEALNYTSEQLYDILLAQKQAMQQAMQQNGQNQQSQQGQQGQQSGQNSNQSQQQDQMQPNQSQNGQGQQGEAQQDQQGQDGQGQESKQNNEGQNGQSQSSQSQSSSSEKRSNKSNPQGTANQSSSLSSDIFDRERADDHSLWEKAFEQSQEASKESFLDKFFKGRKKEGKKSSKDTTYQGQQDIEFEEVDEKTQFQENRAERQARARQRINEMRRNQDTTYSTGNNIEFGDVGSSKPILDWKKLLRREVEKEETIWSQRRSIAENNYAYRLEENEVEDDASTEVMIDVSGSVSLDMVKAFLRQLKPIVKQSKLKVGCFNEKYWGMVEIKTDKDIDRFKIPEEARGHSAWTEDWDLAVRSFSKKREVNKIVFTDGEPCPGTMPREDLRGTNVIWLVYSNREFEPCCGTVIQISARDLQTMQSLYVQEPELTL